MSSSVKPNIFENSLLSHTEKSFYSLLMRDILSKVLQIAKLNTPVILIGEIGSGKKRMAKIIHENSTRAAHPFYSFYCVDLNDDEYQEAFREHLQLSDNHFVLKYDIIEQAAYGVLFLDQFSELSPELMLNIVRSFVKGCEQLYRYSDTAQPRLILSINMESYPNLVNLPEWKEILQMLDLCSIMIPPLRERKEDIELLVDSFLRNMRSNYDKFKNLSISTEAMAACSSYSWPGNIRQLQNALLQGAILSHGETIEPQHLPFSMNWKLPYNFEGSESLK